MIWSWSDPQDYRIQLRQAIKRYLPARGLPLLSQRRWSDRLLIMVMLLLVWSPGTTQVDRFSEARHAVVAMYVSRKRPGRSLAGFMATLGRHTARLLTLVVQSLQRQMGQRFKKQWLTGRFLAFGFDGTKIDCTRTRGNQKHFKNGGRAKSAPQMVLGTMVHLATGLIWSWRHGDAKTAERTLLREMLEGLPQEALLIADAGLTGYDLLRTILDSGRSILIRVGANVQLLKKLGYCVQENHGIVYLWTQDARHQGQKPLILRLWTFRDGRNRRMSLLTNLLTDTQMTAEEARMLYGKRWGVELLFRAMKQTLVRRKMLADAPQNAQRELDWTMVGLWMLGMLAVETSAQKAPAYEGFAQVLRIVRAAMGGRGNGRSSLWRKLRQIRRDCYVRKHAKKARDWPHKKNEPPCGNPDVRMATPREILKAQRLFGLKQAA